MNVLDIKQSLKKEGIVGLEYRNLDERTRMLMLIEIDRDINSRTLYISDNLNIQGKNDYSNLLRNAAASGNDMTLAADIKVCLNSHEKPRLLKSGEYSKPPIMRSNAHEMLAEGEFNRFYVRAVCSCAMEDGLNNVIVYRAKYVNNPRPESDAKIGEAISAQALLSDLRANPGVDTALGLPPGPNSGLSVQLP
ncbi:MAG: hypothetical protein CSYNP_01604 [Syntrophus sp. SKADARSKE-3]|nr:hypothetical protein [Syntrophus sp. SKADARSKE-3]